VSAARSPAIPEALTLERRRGLPEELLEPLRRHPRDSWRPGTLGDLAETWLQRHDLFRRLSTLIAGSIEELQAGRQRAASFAGPFQARMGLLLGELDMHHNVEDHHYFPLFARAAPKLRPGFLILDDDHHRVHKAIHDLAEASRALLAAIASGDAHARALDELAGRMAAFDRTLPRHFDDEEDLIIPLILERPRDDPDFG
jgi:hypothetical protein